MKILSIAIIVLFLLITPNKAFSADPEKITNEGNALYEEGKYQEAIEKYNEAKTLNPNSDIINYDIGAALYKKKDYDNSLKSSTTALATENVLIESNANYNIGSGKYRIGTSREIKNPEEAIKLFKESLKYYKRAIEINNDDLDAKFNYEFIKKKIEELENQENQQNQENQENQEDQENQDNQKDQENQKNQEDQKDQDKEDK